MTGIVFKEKDKELIFDIVGYQYEDTEPLYEYYDANWLVVHIKYKDPDMTYDDVDPCIVTDEFLSLIEDIDTLKEGETGFITDFMEPYLRIAVTKVEDGFAFQIRFVYDNSKGWKEIYVCQKFTPKELNGLNNQFKELYNKYPIRSDIDK